MFFPRRKTHLQVIYIMNINKALHVTKSNKKGKGDLQRQHYKQGEGDWKHKLRGTHHPCHGSGGVVSVEVGGPTYSFFLDDGGTPLVGCTGGHHVVGRVGIRCMTAPAGGRWGVRCDFRRVERRRPSRERHPWNIFLDFFLSPLNWHQCITYGLWNLNGIEVHHSSNWGADMYEKEIQIFTWQQGIYRSPVRFFFFMHVCMCLDRQLWLYICTRFWRGQ